jgi:hypothetical protein
MRTLIALAVPLLILTAGCSSRTDSSDDAAARTETDAAAETATTPAPATDMADAPAPGTEVVLTGNLGCGHCTFHIGTSCAAAVQTADGGIYILRGVEQDSELFQQRKSGKEVRVVGTVSEGEDGTRFLDLESYQM